MRASYRLQVLHTYQPQLALTIASSVVEPSWGYMIKQGPGTIWESWRDTTNSHNHPMFGIAFLRLRTLL